MQPFSIIPAPDQAAALREGSVTDTKFMAGGTNLVDLMKMNIVQPKRVVNINHLDLEELTIQPDGDVHIGALVRNSDLAYHPYIKQHYPVLSEALLSGASPQLRNMATLGGNLMQRTRCPYFYNTASPCNKRNPGTGCGAMDGYNRSNAVLGGSNHCIATHPSDMCVALTALGAIIHTEGSAGKRSIPIEDFHVLPGDTPHIETVLQPGELITGITLPSGAGLNVSHYLKVRDRASYEFALASAAVVLELQNGFITRAKIALGGVGTKPWRSVLAEQVLIGAAGSSEIFQKAAEAALAGAETKEFNAFKPSLAKRTLIHALETATAKG